MNALLDRNKIAKKIQNVVYAQGLTNNNNQKQALNRLKTIWIRRHHRIEEIIFILESQILENKARLKKLRHVIAVQRIARRTIARRRLQAGNRAAMLRAYTTGAHHVLSPGFLARYVIPRSVGVVKKTIKPTTRSSTRLTRRFA